MVRRRLLFIALLLAVALPLGAGERLTLRVVPTVGLAPLTVRVRTDVAPDVDNRVVEIVAESTDFYQSSELSLDGERAPRVRELEYHDLPAGEYRVSATLVSATGRRITANQTVRIE